MQALRGIRDILPPETFKWQRLEQTARDLFERYGYQELRTPLLEEHGLFVRSIGEETDIVQKELFAFAGKDNRMVCLRPEATASAVRAYLEHHLDKEGRLVKWYYLGPMFRAERPQAGRQRQFHQLGVEAIGSSSPVVDAEIILLSCHLLHRLGIDLKKCRVTYNNLGCQEDKAAYRRLLEEKLGEVAGRLCEKCRQRLQRNPWRVLDCKEPQCRTAVLDTAMNLPSCAAKACADCKRHFESMQELVKQDPMGGALCTYEPFLVRGLDYYTRTVFEITHAGLGAQDAVCGGGRYDHLVEDCGGPPTGACGVAFGIERLLLAMEHDKAQPELPEPLSVFFAVLTPELYSTGLKLMQQLRDAGIVCHADYDAKSLKSQLRFADRLGARFIVILGEDEARAGAVQLKDFQAKTQEAVPQRELTDRLKGLLQAHD